MWDILLNVILGLTGIGIMIFVHEAGHYIVARFCGITVEVFSFGLGPKLFSWKRGHTEFRISLLPVGGFCRMKGADDLTRALEAKNDSFIHTEAGSLFAASPGKRFLTYLAGPLSNIIFAIIVYTIFSMMTYTTLSDPARIVVTADYSQFFPMVGEMNAARLHGLETGDTILEVDEIPVLDYQMLVEYLWNSQGKTVIFTVQREGNILTFPVSPFKDKNNRYAFGITSYIEPVVAFVKEDSPEKAAGLLPGDRIVMTQTSEVTNMLDLTIALEASPGIQTYVVARISDDKDASTATVQFIPETDKDGKAQLSFSLASGNRVVTGQSLPKALSSSLTQSLDMVRNTLTSLGDLVTGKGNIRDSFTGPWRASMMIGSITFQGFKESFSSGLRAMLYLLGVVSISLAIANILPIPALDGGFMLICVAEMVMGRQLSPKAYMRIQIIGVICIITIIVIMTLADLRFYVSGK
ncbi:RIP metalloprotease RseP [Parasphaerochaeta coccoides]|uniref:Zinc metalloprotease n=1 Tax=Parasphaerochaeta coccoides (strain ATCC BAA-1237 / DSM 17374 / SPN1) TaxID=760011 RepID=F4GLF2_PARC1|nr:RIP metalloprotease RseP [Parasphaerochaeta coccoides]AEC01922.1 peptidase M50 [Parasphaerochaeta coccoides DSM 17374]